MNLRSRARRSSKLYCRYVPWKVGRELGTDADDHFLLGWGFVITFEFNSVCFFVLWEVVAILLSLGLLIGLYVVENGPAHGQPGVAAAVFVAPITFVSGLCGVVYAIARQKGY